MMWNDYWFMPFPFFGIIFIIVCMAMMFFMMRHGMHRRESNALEILRERYARGEITQTEFEDRRRVLGV